MNEASGKMGKTVRKFFNEKNLNQDGIDPF